MNQEKIGKFIAESRKKKKLTQAELAEKLGVTDKSVGNWENGRNMPDLSLFKPLCDELGITINDLLSGEKISKEKYQEKFEENIVNTIDYSTKRFSKYNNTIALIIMVFGLFLAMSAIIIFPEQSSWGGFYTVFGITIFVYGVCRLTKGMKYSKRMIIVLSIYVLALGCIIFMDYLNVKHNNCAPMIRGEVVSIDPIKYYDAVFYDVIECNVGEENESYHIVKNKEYTHEELFEFCENK